MKKILTLVLGALIMLVATGCSKVPSGNVGVKVYLLGTSKGVDHEVLGVGRYFIGINEDLYLFPTYQQTKVYTQDIREDSPTDESFTFQSVEGMNLNMDLGVTFSVNRDKITTLFQKYRRGIDELKTTIVMNAIRDALNKTASKLPIESIYGSGKAEMFQNIERLVQEELKPNGISVERVYLIGSIRLPPTITKALNSKIEATQRAQQRENELREAEAQGKKVVAEAEGRAKAMIAIAEAESKSNALKRTAITKELIEYEMIQKWDGKMPTVMSGSGSGLIMNLGR